MTGSVWLVVLLWAPWALLLGHLLLRMRLPPTLPPPDPGEDPPFVTVVVPARNEERNIVNCLTSIAAGTYPHFEIIVVDDRSEDGTSGAARSVDRGNARRILVVEGDALPEGWLGKPWACAQGYREARGEVLLFTDADTIHQPELMARAMTALERSESGALTLLGRQLTDSFWERLIQPHVFAALLLRFPNLKAPLPPEKWRDAIANGQFMLFRRTTYDAVGGHEAVRAEVVEDLRLGQLLVRGGHRISAWLAEDVFATRMYQSLPEIIEGWSKNVATASRMSVPRRYAGIALPVTLALILFFWILPPTVVVAALFVPVPPPVSTWGVVSTVLGVLLWGVACFRFRVPVFYALIYPLGSLASLLIFTRSMVRGGRVRWKGRDYQVTVSR